MATRERETKDIKDGAEQRSGGAERRHCWRFTSTQEF